MAPPQNPLLTSTKVPSVNGIVVTPIGCIICNAVYINAPVMQSSRLPGNQKRACAQKEPMGRALKVKLKTNMKLSTVLSTVASVCITLELSVYVSESIQTPLNYHRER